MSERGLGWRVVLIVLRLRVALVVEGRAWFARWDMIAVM